MNRAEFRAIALLFVLSWSLIVWSGCISDQGRFNGVDISGYVRSQTDSSAVPGALVLIAIGPPSSARENFADSTGFFSFSAFFPSERFDTIPFTITVADADGEANGLFLSRDTVLVEEHPDDSTYSTFEVDIYVEMLE